jgi:hypothetical protein
MARFDSTLHKAAEPFECTMQWGETNFNSNNSTNLKANVKTNLNYESESKVGTFLLQNGGGKYRATIPLNVISAL